MKRLLIIIGILIVSGAAIAVAMDQITEDVKTYSWRYKMTVEVETPKGLKTGSAVREIRAYKNNRELNPQFPVVEYEVIGEAVVIDLEEKDILFALIDWDSYEDIFNAFPTEASSAIDRLNYYKDLEIGQSASLKHDHPRIIKFDDIDDVTSIKLVYQNKDYANEDVFIDNFEELFGPNVRLNQIKIEITNEEITRNIESYLNFFQQPDKFISWRKSLRYGDPVAVDRNNFQRKAIR